ncbi:DUF6660 family protein [Pontibacter sp. SGAir0037]|uniref:DUF6660 family protein n=2 Tax=Hymenobacteraceae TaxID=1853232 RepID=UPI00352AD056
MDRASAVSSERQAVAMAGTHQDHQDNIADGCSPFCSCHCCHTHFQAQSTAVIEHTSPQQAIQKVDLYKSSFIPFLSYSIWQPPKVA